MDFRNMIVVCGIPDMSNTAGNRPMQLFIDSQGFRGINYFTMIRIQDIPHMITDHNLVPNQELRLGALQQRKLQALV